MYSGPEAAQFSTCYLKRSWTFQWADGSRASNRPMGVFPGMG